MKSQNINSFLLIWVLLFAGYLGVAQDKDNSDCSKNFEDAQAAYDLGRLNQVVSLLEPCLDKLGDDERLVAFRLLTITHLYSNEDSLATINMERLLRLNPEYRIKTNDPAEFVELYKDFRTRPIYILGGFAGANINRIDVLKGYSLSNSEEDRPVYNTRLSYQVGIAGILPITNHFELVLEASLVRSVVEYESRLFNFSIEGQPEQYTDLVFTEKMLYFSAPLLVRYNFVNKYNFDNTGLKPFIEVGGAVNYLLGSNATAEREDFVSENNQRTVTGADIDVTEVRESLNYSVLLGAGLEYKQGRGSIILDVRIRYDFLNVVNEQNRYLNQNDIFRYGYSDRDFKFNSLLVSVGYQYPIYKPKKIR